MFGWKKTFVFVSEIRRTYVVYKIKEILTCLHDVYSIDHTKGKSVESVNGERKLLDQEIFKTVVKV